MSKVKTPKKDIRKIPELFRAVEKDDRPVVYYGHLISDDGFNFVSFSCFDGSDSHLKERILQKSNFSFSKLNPMDFELQAKRAMCKMHEELQNKKFEFEAAQFQVESTENRLSDFLINEFGK